MKNARERKNKGTVGGGGSCRDGRWRRQSRDGRWRRRMGGGDGGWAATMAEPNLGSGGARSLVRDVVDVVCAMDLLGLAHSAVTMLDEVRRRRGYSATTKRIVDGRIRNHFSLFK
jgi:hypothetical protein